MPPPLPIFDLGGIKNWRGRAMHLHEREATRACLANNGNSVDETKVDLYDDVLGVVALYIQIYVSILTYLM